MNDEDRVRVRELIEEIVGAPVTRWALVAEAAEGSGRTLRSEGGDALDESLWTWDEAGLLHAASTLADADNVTAWRRSSEGDE